MSKSTVEPKFKPFVAANSKIPELTIGPLILGVILGIVFGGSSLYLALKVGMTVSASIPVAVLSITVFRGMTRLFGLKPATILQNNIVQTTGSAGESIAFGVAATMPAVLILGFDMDLWLTMIVAVLGSLLGVLLMIPLRDSLIVKEHGNLTYPEGLACAEVLKTGEEGASTAKFVFGGFFFGIIYKFFNNGMKLWAEAPAKMMSFFKGAEVTAEVSPELLGVGYIIGPRVAATTFAGGVLSFWLLIPMIKLFGDGLGAPLFPGKKLISEMATMEIWKSYILYIGAGAVAAAGIISLVQTLPTIIRGAIGGMQTIKAGIGSKGISRTDRDLPLSFVWIGSLVIVAVIWAVPAMHMNLLGALLIIGFGFLFVTVSSRLAGEIGTSANPVSGMTVATLLITSLIFLGLGWTGPDYQLAALSVAGIVCVAAAVAAATSQDLKTGFLVGATPRSQQISLLIGSMASALVIGYTLKSLNDASTIYSSKAVPEGTRVEDVNKLTELKTIKIGENPPQEFHVLRMPESPTTGPLSKLAPGTYLVKNDGVVQFLMDPGINGTLDHRDDGTRVNKFEAPKARLMSIIIDGILTQRLPWGLVLLGVAIAIVLELCGIASLPFAVGVYLPMSTTAPIFCGGLIRWIVERGAKRKGVHPSEEEKESGSGLLFSSGLIAGGSIGGILLAFLAWKQDWGKAIDFSQRFKDLSESNWFATLAFVVMMVIMYSIARPKGTKAKTR